MQSPAAAMPEPFEDASQRSSRRVAVVTGAASGIGAATAVELGRLGCRIVLADLPGRDRSAVARRVEAAGGEATSDDVDVRAFASVDALVATTVDRLGAIDILFANAGVTEQSFLATGDPDEWRDVVETNLLGVAHCLRALLPRIAHQRHADIVVNASTSGREISYGSPLYTASKWGLVGLTRSLRRELKEAGSAFRVTLLEPGLVDTPLARSIPGLARQLEAGHALEAEDVARLVGFVVSQPPHVLLHELRIEPIHPPLPASGAQALRGRVRRALGR